MKSSQEKTTFKRPDHEKHNMKKVSTKIFAPAQGLEVRLKLQIFPKMAHEDFARISAIPNERDLSRGIASKKLFVLADVTAQDSCLCGSQNP